MIDLSIKNLKKAYERGNNILDGLSLDVQAGEHVGILGKNGCGKTTLFRLLSGEIGEDEGEIAVASGKRLGLISQIPVYPAGYTTEDVLKTAHARLDAISRRLAELAERMAEDASPEILREYDRLSADFERLGGYDTDFERNRVANGLDIPSTMRARLFSQLSGGEKTRVNLARLILEDTDILLLDEPTNHLDLHATEWLENYILKFRGTVLAISHDRWFLDTVAQRCVEIVHGKAEFYSGNYSFFMEEKQRRTDEQRRRFEKEQAEIERLSATARKMHEHNTEHLNKRAASIEKRIERLRTTERPEVQRQFKARFGEREFFGDEVYAVEGLSKSFGEKRLFSDVEVHIEGGERIALLGDNGAGKSTFLKILLGEEEPDSGHIYKGPTVKTAYLPQLIRFEHPERSLYDTMIYEARCTPQSARDRLGAFHFSGEDVFKEVGTLSGGELSRLRLCMLMKDEINFLVLDEPTNHLDIASREWIESALENYGEALLFVSHDRWFIEKFATRVWEIRDGQLTDFRGGFTAFREYKERQQALALANAHREEKPKTPKPVKKGSLSQEKQLARTEREITKLEGRIASLDAECEANASDYQKLMELDAQRQELSAKLDALYEAWEAMQT